MNLEMDLSRTGTELLDSRVKAVIKILPYQDEKEILLAKKIYGTWPQEILMLTVLMSDYWED